MGAGIVVRRDCSCRYLRLHWLQKKGGERRERESFGTVWPLCVKFHHSYALREAAVSTGRRGLSQVIALSGRAAVSTAANSAASRQAHNSVWVAEDKKLKVKKNRFKWTRTLLYVTDRTVRQTVRTDKQLQQRGRLKVDKVLINSLKVERLCLLSLLGELLLQQ